MIRNKIVNITVAFTSLLSFAALSPAVLANGNDNPGNKVTICHATGSSSNPFVQISPNANGVINGHVGHQDGRDIIPPFDYNDHGTTKHFAGQNWNTQGMAIFNNGCKVAGGQGGGGGTTPVTPGGGQGGGVTLGTNTNQTQVVAAAGQGAGVSAVPAGAVDAGLGGVSSLSIGAVTGLLASIATAAFGVRKLTSKSEL